MFKIENLENNQNIKIVEQKNDMKVLEYVNDLSVTPDMAVSAYFSSKMNVRKRQLLITLYNNEFTISGGEIKWI